MCEVKKEIRISPFLDDNGKVMRIPSPNRTRIPVLAYLAGKFEEGRIYNEKEINEIIDKWHTFRDYFILRRLLVDYKLLERTKDGSKYWLAGKDIEKEGGTNGQEKGAKESV